MLFLAGNLMAQNRPAEAIMKSPGTELWLGSYGTFRLTDKLFWAGELHYRRAATDNMPYIGKMSKMYNRHGLKILFSKKFSFTVGGVLRLNFEPEMKTPDTEYLTLEPRIWHEYLYFTPLTKRILTYHRIRIEHRWSRSNIENSEYTFRNRYRYMFMLKIPINNTSLNPGTFYANPSAELIMQSGKTVIDSPMEDLRLYPLVGYVASPRLSYSLGMAYTISQEINNGAFYRTRWLLRANVYISLDLRKFEQKIPEIRVLD